MAAASLGRLTLDLAVRLGSYEQGMTQAERKTKQTTDNMNKAFAGFKDQVADALGGTQLGSLVDSFNTKIGSLKGGAMVAGAAFAGMAVGGIALAFGALSKLAIETAKADAQLLVLANRASTSAENFQILQYAASGLGVTQDQLGSILADVQEKLGEFSATQGGGAADFFDALKNNTKMTDDQIKKFGQTLQGKDGVEAIQMLNDKMDELGVTTQERRFVFESLASDLGNLAPLFVENGELLQQYGDALKDAGVIKSAEALEQSKLLAAQTESVRMRFDGLKSQLAGQMMPVLNSLLSQFIDGAAKGGQFGSIIQSVGVIAKGVSFLIIGLAASIKSIVIAVSAFAEQAANISITAQNVWNADGVVDKAKALGSGVKEGASIAKNAMTGLSDNFSSTLKSMGEVMGANVTKATDPLTQALLKTSEAANQSAKGLKVDTKAADENAKAKEKAAASSAKAAKEQENLNKMVGASALSGLRIKSSEAFAGGQVRGYTANFAQMAQKSLGSDLSRFTAFNDLYHKGTNSKHATGNAFDFTIADASKSTQAVKQLEDVAKRYGYVVNILDEYKQKSARATGGHLHVSVLGFKGSAEAAKVAKEELDLVAKTNEEADRIRVESQRAQQSVIRQYLTEREKLEEDHSDKLLDIKKAFAGDKSAIKKYSDLQNAAYQKDVEEFKKAQEEKRQAAFGAINNPIGDMIGMGVNARARASLGSSEYDRWSMNNEQQDGYSQLGNSLSSARSGIENNEFLSETERYQQLNDAYKVYLDSKKALTEEYAQQEKDLDQQQFETKMQVYSQIAGLTAQTFDQMTSMLRDSVGESNALYKTMFFAGRAAAVAQAIVNTEEGATKALAQGGAYGSLLAGVVRATGYASVGIIAGQAIAGMAHDGIDNIPKEGTWLLDGGERVLNPQQNKDLTRYLSESRSNQSSQPQTVENVVKVIMVKDEEEAKEHLYSKDGEKAFLYHMKRNKSKL